MLKTKLVGCCLMFFTSIANAQLFKNELPAQNYVDRANAINAFAQIKIEACELLKKLPAPAKSVGESNREDICNNWQLEMNMKSSQVVESADRSSNAIGNVIHILAEIDPYHSNVKLKLQFMHIQGKLYEQVEQYIFSMMNFEGRK